MDSQNEKKVIVQNAILIDTSEPPADYRPEKQQETELQIKNEKKKNFFNRFTEKLKASQSETLKNKLLKYKAHYSIET